MFFAFLLIPFATTITTFLLYKHVGKRDFFRLDIVQFLYAFVFTPIMFLWMKAFLAYAARNEIGIPMSQNQLFALDSAFSIIFLYFTAFVAIHSLTKTFEIKAQKDPLYDIIEHAEQFHLWISHISLYLLGLLFLVMLGIMNIFVPLDLQMTKPIFWLLIVIGVFMGSLVYAAIWLSNFNEKSFMRVMKLGFGVGLSTLIFAYFLFQPKFGASNVLYWIIFAVYSSMVSHSFFLERSERFGNHLRKYHHKYEEGWKKGNYLLLSEKRKNS